MSGLKGKGGLVRYLNYYLYLLYILYFFHLTSTSPMHSDARSHTLSTSA